MAEWNDFYVAVVGASAALTGLIFVGISINLTKILSIRGLADRALLSLLLLINTLVLSILFLVPHQTTKILGIEVIIIGTLTWITIFRLDFRVFTNVEHQYKRRYLIDMLMDQVATILFIVTSIALIFDWTNSEYWMVPAIILSIVKAIIDGWVLLVEINR